MANRVFHVYVGLDMSDVPGHFQEAYIYFILRNIEHYLAEKYSNSTAAVQGSRYGDTVNVHTHEMDEQIENEIASELREILNKTKMYAIGKPWSEKVLSISTDNLFRFVM
jgi:hypothetical protein